MAAYGDIWLVKIQLLISRIHILEMNKSSNGLPYNFPHENSPINYTLPWSPFTSWNAAHIFTINMNIQDGSVKTSLQNCVTVKFLFLRNISPSALASLLDCS